MPVFDLFQSQLVVEEFVNMYLLSPLLYISLFCHKDSHNQ